MSKDQSSELETFVIAYQEAGQAWVKAKLVSDQLEEDRKSYLASIMNEYESEAPTKISEAKLERLALGNEKYRSYVKSMCQAVSETLSKKVRYDALDKLFEAKRSGLSFEKEVIKKGIFNQGGG